ncbi:alpha-hydroxy acid oxidase [Aureimonas altamirensis]|uniref:alpha-hydroxy acid oxidase n=1 Tax=Aureimonas altamirensis TaxID=370622 RepID=UPI002554725D|nr:alpha-hydroxy acid oxidase [Aureimonas altamirensis]
MLRNANANQDPSCYSEYRSIARAKLSEGVFGFLDGGAGDGRSADINHEKLSSVRLAGPVLSGSVEVDLATVFCGIDLPCPIAIAPTAYHALVCDDAEVGTAMAAAEAGIAYVVSSMSTAPFEAIADTGATLLYQIYKTRDAELESGLLEDALKAGCRALVLTVDVPVFGNRLSDRRTGFKVPHGLAGQNKIRAAAARNHGGAVLDMPEREFVSTYLKGDLAWEDVSRLCRNVDVPVVLKGILRVEDAMRAFEAGAAAVIVSNHGGRQLDAHPATIDALRHIRSVLGPSASICLDGGIQSGTDVLRSIACGADLAMLGRGPLYALAAGGRAALARYLIETKTELQNAMTICGIGAVRLAPSLIYS